MPAMYCQDFSRVEEAGQQRGSACAIIVAGGTGSRFGNPGGKQLVEIADRPMLSWTIEAFDRTHTIGHIVVVCPEERCAEYRARAVEPYGFETPITFADAGMTRQDSTHAGLVAAPEGCAYVAGQFFAVGKVNARHRATVNAIAEKQYCEVGGFYILVHSA